MAFGLGLVAPVSAETAVVEKRAPAPAPPMPQAPEVITSVATPAGPFSIARNAGELVVAPCKGRCDWSKATVLPVPAELLPAVTATAVTTLQLDKKRTALRLRLPAEARAWEVLVALPIKATDPVVVAFADWTGMSLDDEGERAGKWIEVYGKDGGLVDVVVGGLRDDVTLCGRRTLIDPKVLYAESAKLRRIKLQRLSDEERNVALRLQAVADDGTTGTSVSRARVASSAKGSPAALSDGDPTTSWAEDRGGDGEGEFVVFKTPSALPIKSFHWRLPDTASATPEPAPPEAASASPQSDASAPSKLAPAASAPSSPAPAASAEAATSTRRPTAFWVATDSAVYHVETKPEDLATNAGFSVELPEAITTSCVALILDKASGSDADGDVTFSEFEARAAVSDADIDRMITELDDPARDPAPLVATLSALGSGAATALCKRHRELSPAGQARALSVYDSLPCEDAASGYARAVIGDGAESDVHATQRLRECAGHGANATLSELKRAGGSRAMVLAMLYAELDPEGSVEEMVPLLAKSNRARRKALRSALSSVARQEEVRRRFGPWLADPDLDVVAQVDLLRALGPNVVAFQPAATELLRSLIAKKPEFRERYLLLEPAAQLVTAEPAFAEYLTGALSTDPMVPVRARAARLFPATAAFLPALLKASADPEMRVREAAVRNLAENPTPGAQTALVNRLQQDPWPLVRAAAVNALRAQPGAAAVDVALAAAVATDEAASVRRPAVLALGARNARGQAKVVRERLLDDKEDVYVRAAAAATLGVLCDQSVADALTGYAKAISRLSTDEDAQVLGRAAVSALGRLSPPDLKERLSMFEGPEVPPWAKQVAQVALDAPEQCR